ncbi:glycosyltransferase family 4 protein [Phocaeicola sartorii]|uniref:glycosyltransferase family 4 protein n=1 Tax=Phocaeicola sartorii TaxID=671267 RepID=UPI0013644C0A|nr:glycosyltransferase family 4 protein [Phocaeicola sartorii]NBH68544.1 glycosyltransferase [Phocaeicola sartorii]
MMKPDKYICYIGRPSYQKNPLFLVEVVKDVHVLHPEVKFVLLGVGYYSPELDSMKAKIAEYALEEVISLFPWLNHKETLEYVNNSLFYLTVARYEGLPLAVIEAMSLSKAIVASDVAGNKDCVQDGYNGRLIPLEKEAFVKAICELVEDKVKRDLYGNNSRILFEQKFLITNRIQELEAIYQSVKL